MELKLMSIKTKTRITHLDIIISFILISLAVYIAYRIRNELNYRWQWNVIPQYLFRYDEEKNQWVMNLLMQGLKTTLTLSFWSVILATIIGSVMGMFRTSSDLFKRLLGQTYVGFIRNTPPLVIVLIFYYFISDQIMPIFGIDDLVRSQSGRFKYILEMFSTRPELFSQFVSAVATIALFEGATITEIIRSGIGSIERGQWEAANALGLTWWQNMRHVILPQAFQKVLPPLAGEFINTVKNSAIVSVISIQELTFQGLSIMNSTLVTFEICITVSALYLVVCLTLSLGVSRLENLMGKRI